MNINECIKKRGISLYKLAKETGIAYSTIHNLANGNQEKTKRKNREKIKAYMPEWDPGTLLD